MERIRKTEPLVVQMVTKLVEQSAEKRLELDHLGPLCGPHPERHPEATFLVRLIEAVKLTGLPGRPAFRDPHPNGGNAEGEGEPVQELLSRELCRAGLSTRKSARQSFDPFAMGLGPMERDRGDGVALVVDSLLSRSELLVVGKTQRGLRPRTRPRAIGGRRSPLRSRASTRRRAPRASSTGRPPGLPRAWENPPGRNRGPSGGNRKR